MQRWEKDREKESKQEWDLMCPLSTNSSDSPSHYSTVSQSSHWYPYVQITEHFHHHINPLSPFLQSHQFLSYIYISYSLTSRNLFPIHIDLSFKLIQIKFEIFFYSIFIYKDSAECYIHQCFISLYWWVVFHGVECTVFCLLYRIDKL